MKKFAHTFLPICAMLAFATLSHAQTAGPSGGAPPAGFSGKAGGRSGPQGLMKLTDSILAKLDLTADQKTKISELESKFKADGKALRKTLKADATPEDRKALRPKMLALTKEFRDNLLAILTPAQKVDFETQMKAELEKQKKARDAAKAGGGTPPPVQP